MNKELEEVKQRLLDALYKKYSLHEYHKLSHIVVVAFEKGKQDDSHCA
jgi:hypothetical protein